MQMGLVTILAMKYCTWDSAYDSEAQVRAYALKHDTQECAYVIAFYFEKLTPIKASWT
jgi:hypothetical protein